MFEKIELLHTPTPIKGDSVTLGVYATQMQKRGSQTSSFKAATVRFDTDRRTMQIKDFDPLPMPAGLKLHAGLPVTLRLLDHEGNEKKVAPRTALLVAKKNPKTEEESTTEFSIKGEPKQKAKLSEKDGWTHQVMRFRAYKTHQGIETDDFPEWITESARRTRLAWNELAALCRNARRACTTVKVEAIIAFRDDVFLPELEAYNRAMGRANAKQKISCPEKLMDESPNILDLTRFAGKMRKRAEKGKVVPEGLEQKIWDFVNAFPYDLTPINEFEAQVPALVKQAIEKYHLSSSEGEYIGTAFTSTLKRRRTNRSAFDKGWPAIVYSDSPKANNWAIGRRTGCVDSQLVFEDEGVSGLSLGAPVAPADAGHPNIIPGKWAARHRRLRPATIQLSVLEPTDKTEIVKNEAGEDEERTIYKSKKRSYTFAALDHRVFPANSHLVEWKLVHEQAYVPPSLLQNGLKNKRAGGYEMWLCLTLKVKNPKVGKIEKTAGVDIGWWREDKGIRVATVFNEAKYGFQNIHLDLEASQGSTREPFTLNIGPTRWGLRSRKFALIAQEKNPMPKLGVLTNREFWPGASYEDKLTEYHKNLRVGLQEGKFPLDEAMRYFDKLLKASHHFAFVDDYPGRTAIQKHRDAMKDATKAIIKLSLGKDCPTWFDRAGLTKIHETVELLGNPTVKALVGRWAKLDDLFGERHRFIAAKLASRIEKGYELIAHDVCKWLAGDNQRIAFEGKFLQKLAGVKENEDPKAVKRGAKYRQLASLGTLMTKIQQTARKYGMASIEVAPEDTTSICNVCKVKNEVGIERIFDCVGCKTRIDQDQNAAVNLSDAARKADKPKPKSPIKLPKAA